MHAVAPHNIYPASGDDEWVAIACRHDADWERLAAVIVDHDPATAEWGLWPTVEHSEMGRVRVDGLPVHLSRTDWEIKRGAPCLGEDNDYVFGELLGLEGDEVARLRQTGVV